MITSLLETQVLIASILLGETKQANMLLNKQVNLMRAVSNLLGINMNVCLTKIRKQHGFKETQRQALTLSFGKSLKQILVIVEQCLNVNIQVLMLINVSISQEAAIDMRSLRRYVYRLIMMAPRISLIGSSREAVMKKENQRGMFKANPTMFMTSTICRSNYIQNSKKPKNVQSIEFNQQMSAITGLSNFVNGSSSLCFSYV